MELKAAARAAVVEEASGALARRLAVGPFEREDLTTFQKIIKGDSKLKHDQVRSTNLEGGGVLLSMHGDVAVDRRPSL